MRCFIWERADNTTHHWHPEAGVLVVAEDVATARLLLVDKVNEECEALAAPPDREFDAGQSDRLVILFPDAGCC